MKSRNTIILLVFVLYLFGWIFGSTAEATFVVRDSEGRLIMTTDPKYINPFELSYLATPVLASNLVVLALFLLYYEKKFSIVLNKIISTFAEFEISRKTAFIVLLALLSFYTIISVGELPEEGGTGDYQFVKSLLEDFKKGELSPTIRPVKFSLSYLSEILFQNLRTVPFITSIGILLLTYSITKEISKKRVGGVIAMTILLQSSVFLKYDTVFAYSNFWIFFYLLSLYLIYKKWYLSPIPFFLSFLSKELTIAYLPFSLFFIHKIGLSKNKKIFLFGLYGLIAIIAGAIFIQSIPESIFTPQLEAAFSFSAFWETSVNILLIIRFDWLLLMFLSPLTVALFLLRIKRGLLMADSLMLFIFGIIMTSILIAAIIDIPVLPYRLILLVIFFAIGVGTIISKASQVDMKRRQENKLTSCIIFAITFTVTIIPTISAIFPAMLLSFSG